MLGWTGDLVGSQNSSPETIERLGMSKFSTRIQRVHENPSISIVVKIMSQLNGLVHRLVVILPADYDK